jgi:hypothetical protein
VLLLLVIFGAIASWWAPTNRTFWAPVIMCLVVLTGLGYSMLPGEGTVGHVRRIVPLALATVLLAGNLGGGILHKHSRDDARCPVVMGIQRNAGAGSLVILRDSVTWRLLNYYCPSLHSMPVYCAHDAGGGELRAAIEPAMCEAARALSRGEKVFMASDVIPRREDIVRVCSDMLGADVLAAPCFTCTNPSTGHGPFTMYEIRIYAGTRAKTANALLAKTSTVRPTRMFGTSE